MPTLRESILVLDTHVTHLGHGSQRSSATRREIVETRESDEGREEDTCQELKKEVKEMRSTSELFMARTSSRRKQQPAKQLRGEHSLESSLNVT